MKLKDSHLILNLTQSHSNQNSAVLVLSTDIDQWSRIKSPEINPQVYGQLIFNKGTKTIQWENNNSFNKWC